jgi:hypothetical protein
MKHKLNDNEPTLGQIDDYNHELSGNKKTTVIISIVIMLLIGVIYTVAKFKYDTVSDYIGEKNALNIPH